MKGQFSMGALKPPYHKNPVGQKVTDEGKLPTVAGEIAFKTGAGKPTVFPKQVLQVRVRF
jgi:hypothetical protein